jgi:hypothetical protein
MSPGGGAVACLCPLCMWVRKRGFIAARDRDLLFLPEDCLHPHGRAVQKLRQMWKIVM